MLRFAHLRCPNCSALVSISQWQSQQSPLKRCPTCWIEVEIAFGGAQFFGSLLLILAAAALFSFAVPSWAHGAWAVGLVLGLNIAIFRSLHLRVPPKDKKSS
jgi:hypothetical protein